MRDLFIQRLEQLSNTTFKIVWSDGTESIFSLAQLQKGCPCARCQASALQVEEQVRATRIYSIGNYALGISFTSGCSRGVYTFQYLRALGDAVERDMEKSIGRL